MFDEGCGWYMHVKACNQSLGPQVHILFPRQTSVGVLDGCVNVFSRCPHQGSSKHLTRACGRIVGVRPSLQRYARRRKNIGHGLVVLEARRRIQDTVLLYKLLNALIDCPQQFERINLRLSSRTRSQELFVRLQLHTLFTHNRAIPRMQNQLRNISIDTAMQNSFILFFNWLPRSRA
ncbi:hypothetical protein J6590_071620 [Homalodisca vitripennis]|nr:hypothetical protein J6590_071620 [Homalodisca vitripennis]